MTEASSSLEESFQVMESLLLPLMVVCMTEWIQTTTLRDLLHRDPTPLELFYYDCQLQQQELARQREEEVRWWEDRLTSLEKIHSLVWKGMK